MRAQIRDLVGVVGEMPKLDRVVKALARARHGIKSDEPAPHRRLFGDIGDFQWWWLNTTGYRRLGFLQDVLPSLPHPITQRNFIGRTGDAALQEGFDAYRTWKALVAKHGKPLGPDSAVLDFGCGWGRILRFFLREVPRDNLFGADVMPFALELCKQTNPWGQFRQVPSAPPSDLPSDKFDLIYLFSVFSHLSESACDAWLTEFHRLLKPGGILIATTWPRDFIEGCEKVRQGGNPNAHDGARLSFVGTADWLARYDRGEVCHSAVGGGPDLDKSFYGETCIPEAYVRRKWTDRFEFCEYVADSPVIYQDIIVVRKPLRPAASH